MKELTSKHILVVDDETDICEILKFNLQNEGFEVDTASSAEEAAKLLGPQHCLLLLDVMMGGMSGFRFAEQLRKADNTIPIIFLTAKDTENDMLTGFSVGGDDFISKPFSFKEIIARVKAIIRRLEQQEATPAIELPLLNFGDLQIDLDKKQVLVAEQAIPLTKKEFEILYLLAKQPQRIFTREEILSKVWKNESYILERTVDVHITRLRKKLGKSAHYIANRSGYGYCFSVE